MALVINCECGFVVRGADEDELVVNAQQHTRADHGMEITREQALAVAETV
ncbi:MAG TPA: DUF1059 domain-containing protein [Actinomycetota bacterium]|jgi:predicted small metal-binding protein|nr:DUF1059 domain-containing protein [Actinomycetota bacterium]